MGCDWKECSKHGGFVVWRCDGIERDGMDKDGMGMVCLSIGAGLVFLLE